MYRKRNVNSDIQNSNLKDRLLTRDLNSCLNIIRLAEHIIYNKTEFINLGIYGRKNDKEKQLLYNNKNK